MLIENSLPGCTKAYSLTSFSSHITKQHSCDWVSGAELLEMSPKNDKPPLGDCRKPNSKDGAPCSVNSVEGSEPSTFSAISGSSKPVVYQRRKFRRNPLTTSLVETSADVRPGNGCPSELCSEVHSGALKEDFVSGVNVATIDTAAPILLPAECNGGTLLSKSESCNGSPEVKELSSEAASRSDMHRSSDFCVNDSYSSSKLDLDLGSSSLKTDVDDAGECSSSGDPEGLYDNMPAKDVCIAILRSYGLLEKVVATELRDSDTSSANCRMISCKACDCSETTLKMLMCDNCEDVYHISCCNPRIKKIPRNEWFCQSCLRKKRKLLEKSTCKSLSGLMEIDSSSNILSEGESGPIARMLKDTGIYRTSVRIGNKFQAEVPDWTGPVMSEVDRSSEPLDIRPSVSSHDCSYDKPSAIRSIGNWLQCREVLVGIGESVDGSICGKWRRAPLFEVQTEDWECFCAVRWDPAHADCAVPQELETEEVLKQLKYIEMLKPRLAAKRCKLDQTLAHNASQKVKTP